MVGDNRVARVALKGDAPMKTILAALIALSLAATIAAPATAGGASGGVVNTMDDIGE